MKIVFEEELKGPTGPIGKLGALPRCPKCGAYHLMWDPETDISKCRCCGYENIEEARQNFEKRLKHGELKHGERSADEAMLLGQLMAVELKHVNRKRLKELIEADKDGRVAIFPCKQDDYLWHWRELDILGPTCYRVTGISYLNGRTVLNTNLLEVIDARRIGDDFFLTEAEARKAREEGRV